MSNKAKKIGGIDFEGIVENTFPSSSDGYELLAKVGKGAFAEVWQANCASKSTEVAVKIIDLDSFNTSLADIAEETKMMRLCKHPNLLSSLTSFVVKTDLWLVMPLIRKGSCLRIMRYLKSKGKGEGLKEEWIAIVLKATLEGLKYFHGMNQVHRDIKAGNLLMQNDGTVVISDFGVSAFVKRPGDRTGNRRTFVGTPCWMAPEVMEQSEAYDEKADIWSVGITALELAKGYAPYARLNPMAVMIQTIREDPPSLKTYEADGITGTEKFSRHFKEIVAMCLQKNPKLRPSAAALLARNFVARAKDKSVLVRDLLDAIPIPDTKDVVDEVEAKTEVQKFLERPENQNFVPGATWDLSEEMAKQKKKEGKVSFADNLIDKEEGNLGEADVDLDSILESHGLPNLDSQR